MANGQCGIHPFDEQQLESPLSSPTLGHIFRSNEIRQKYKQVIFLFFPQAHYHNRLAAIHYMH